MFESVDKQAIINEYLSGATSYRKLEKKYGLSRQTINRLVLNHQNCSRAKALDAQTVNLHPMQENELPDKQQCRDEEIAALHKQLEQERLHNRLLNAMIDIAEETLHIPIRKKYGTRQSKQ